MSHDRLNFIEWQSEFTAAQKAIDARNNLIAKMLAHSEKREAELRELAPKVAAMEAVVRAAEHLIYWNKREGRDDTNSHAELCNALSEYRKVNNASL